MPPAEPETPIDTAGQFEYFMLRVYRTEGYPQSVAGQMERLGTGEKQRFETAGELLALVTRWPVTTAHGGVQP